MNTWRVIFATIVLFGTGVVTGALVVRHSERIQAAPAHHTSAPPIRTGPISLAGNLRLEFLRRAERELNLAPGQRERIDKIMKESQERTRTILEPVSADLQAELRRTKDEFFEVLTPPQRRHFDELVRKQQQRPRDSRHPAGPRLERTAESNSPAQ